MLEEGGTGGRWRLAVTRRCLEEDLRLIGQDWRQSLHAMVRAFEERRGSRPDGRERILELIGVLSAPVFSLHSGDSRAATWYDREEEVVWLLAVAEAHDYDYIVALGERGRLLPTVEDYDQFELEATPDFVNVMTGDVTSLLRLASLNRDELIEGTLGGRIAVRLCWESDDPDLLTVAVSNRVIPGDLELPADWQLQVAASFFPGVSFAEFPPFPLDFDNTFVRHDELALSHWAPEAV